ncbi:hypothetical protein ACH47Z_40915 [Streptomyces sp. NPDC020192]|uniref:hypothetical protein n=1 Tax=Streptomyces sp. NPDC020192 TaxID=3365066 RepID=UPI0037A8CF76
MSTRPVNTPRTAMLLQASSAPRFGGRPPSRLGVQLAWLLFRAGEATGSHVRQLGEAVADEARFTVAQVRKLLDE